MTLDWGQCGVPRKELAATAAERSNDKPSAQARERQQQNHQDDVDQHGRLPGLSWFSNQN